MIMPAPPNPYADDMLSPSLRWGSALIPSVASASMTTYLLTSGNWRQWGIEEMTPMTPSPTSFADLANITLTADCISQGAPVEPCDPYGRPFQPYAVLPARALAFFNIGLDQTGILGVLLAFTTVAMVIGLAILLAKSWQRRAAGLLLTQAAIALAAISPAVVLGMERGQIEQLTAALVVIALLTLVSQRNTRWLGLVTSLLATMTKYLSVGMFLAFANRETFTRRRWAPIFAAALSGVFLIISLPNMLQAAETSGSGNPQTSMSAFGLTATIATPLSGSPLYYGPPENIAAMWPTLRIIGLAIFIVLVAALFFIIRNVQLPDSTSPEWTLTIGSGGVLLIPYLIGSSHDYRLIFLIPVIAGAGMWLGSTEDKRSRTIAVFVIAASTLSAVTSASMLPTPQGWRWPASMVIVGDIGLIVTLALTATCFLLHIAGSHNPTIESGSENHIDIRGSDEAATRLSE